MHDIAIIGATGAVGREMIKDLEASKIPCRLRLFASARSRGIGLTFRQQTIDVCTFDLSDMGSTTHVLMSAGGDFSKEFSPSLVDQGMTVIDNSSAFRLDQGIELIVPEINGGRIRGRKGGQIIANPNCSTIQLVMCLKPLADTFGLSEVIVSTYQSVSGSGQKGIHELETQVKDYVNGKKMTPEFYGRPIAFNVIPAIDIFDEHGHCREETKMVLETRKILGIEDLFVLAQAVRVPTFFSHGESCTVKLSAKVTVSEVRTAFERMPGVKVIDDLDYDGLPCPVDAAGHADVLVSRIRLPFGQKDAEWVQFWNVADNLKKGAATNAVQILKEVLHA